MITAQVACEAIVNHPDDGWETSTMEAVYRDAVQYGVPSLYVDLLDEVVKSRLAAEAAWSSTAPEGREYVCACGVTTRDIGGRHGLCSVGGFHAWREVAL